MCDILRHQEEADLAQDSACLAEDHGLDLVAAALRDRSLPGEEKTIVLQEPERPTIRCITKNSPEQEVHVPVRQDLHKGRDRLVRLHLEDVPTVPIVIRRCHLSRHLRLCAAAIHPWILRTHPQGDHVLHIHQEDQDLRVRRDHPDLPSHLPTVPPVSMITDADAKTVLKDTFQYRRIISTTLRKHFLRASLLPALRITTMYHQIAFL